MLKTSQGVPSSLGSGAMVEAIAAVQVLRVEGAGCRV